MNYTIDEILNAKYLKIFIIDSEYDCREINYIVVDKIKYNKLNRLFTITGNILVDSEVKGISVTYYIDYYTYLDDINDRNFYIIDKNEFFEKLDPLYNQLQKLYKLNKK